MFQAGRTYVTFIAIALILVAGGYFLWHQLESQTNNLPKEFTPPQRELADIQRYGTSTEVYNSYAGVISQNTDGQNVYTSTKYHLSFSYPQGWSVGDNHLGYGTFQVSSPNIGGEADYVAIGNKIEAMIVSGDPHDGEKSTGIAKEFFTSKEVPVSRGIATRYDVSYPAGGAIFVVYNISIPGLFGRFLTIAIYGNPGNFYVLDELVKSLKWLQQ